MRTNQSESNLLTELEINSIDKPLVVLLVDKQRLKRD